MPLIYSFIYSVVIVVGFSENHTEIVGCVHLASHSRFEGWAGGEGGVDEKRNISLVIALIIYYVFGECEFENILVEIAGEKVCVRFTVCRAHLTDIELNLININLKHTHTVAVSLDQYRDGFGAKCAKVSELMRECKVNSFAQCIQLPQA